LTSVDSADIMLNGRFSSRKTLILRTKLGKSD